MRLPQFVLSFAVWAIALALTNADAETWDLGDLDQYEGRGKNPSSLSESTNTMWMSGAEGDGFDIVLSPDLQTKLQEKVDGCKEKDNLCFQDLKNILDSSTLELDRKLERRDFVALLSKRFVSLPAASIGVLGIIMAYIYTRPEHVIIQSHFVPETQASSVGHIATATEVILSAEGSLVMTITPTSDPATITGSATPEVTSISTATDGYEKGDFVITLDESLAERMDEFIRRTRGATCDAPPAFLGGSVHAQVSDYGAAICGAQELIENAGPHGPFSDFALIQAPQLPFTPGDIGRAAAAVADFARDYRFLLELTPEDATALGHAAFALAVDVLIDNISLGSKNPVRHSTLSGTITSEPTQTSCSTASKCEATCEQLGMLEHCATSCTPITGCATATATTDSSISSTTTKYYTWPTITAAPTSTAQPNPECAMDKPGRMQWDAFHGSEYSVASNFCDEIEKNQRNSLSWVVDSKGSQLSKKFRRSPPVTPDDYKDYKVELTWEPRDGFLTGSCPQSCMDTYKRIAMSPCGHTGGTQNVMAIDGSWDIGCGTYSWKIIIPPPEPEPEPTKTPMELGRQWCYEEDNFPDHPDTWGSAVTIGAGVACHEMPEEMGPDSDIWEKTTYNSHQGNSALYFSVEWKAGCVTDVETQNPKAPLGNNDYANKEYECFVLFSENWSEYEGSNGGVGGWRQAGCLSYAMSPV